MVPSPPEFRRDAYRALGGMDNNSPGTLRPEIESDDKIGDAIQRRITSDPLAGMVRRSSRPQSEYSRLMAFIDEVAHEIRIPHHDYNEDDARYVRVAALVKILYGLLHADGMNQSVIEECFAICVIERISRMHADGVYIWRKTAWEKTGTQNPTTHDMKAEWKRCMDSVSGFFFSLSGREVGKHWEEISGDLILQRESAKASGSDVLLLWEERRRLSVTEKERQYGSSRGVTFSRTADWQTVAGISAMRMSLSAEAHLFSRPGTGFQIKQTYESPKVEDPRLSFLDCVLMYGPDGSLVEDVVVRCPRFSQFYQLFDFELLDDSETQEERDTARDNLAIFLKSTWHGNSGAHHAEMMALTLAYANREVGRFFVLPDRSDAGKTTHDVVLSYFLGASDSSGRSSMSGTLHSDWLCDEKALGFEGHHILHCKFTFTPELSTKPILNDVYKRLPTAVTMKLRKPHSDQVFDGCFGRCVHFLETNFAPKMMQKEDSLASLAKRTVCVIFSKKRTFAKEPSEVDERGGVYLMRSASDIRRTALTPSTRRAFIRYWVNFTREYPLGRCEEMLADLSQIDKEFGSTLKYDTEEFCKASLGRTEAAPCESYASTTPEFPHANDFPLGRNAPPHHVEDHMETLVRAHRASGRGSNMRAYKLRDMPNEVLPGLKAAQSSKQKPTKIENFVTALGDVTAPNGIPLFGKTFIPNEFHRLDIDASKYIRLIKGKECFAPRTRQADIFEIRYDYSEPEESGRMESGAAGEKNEASPIREIFNMRSLREYIPHCRKEPEFNEEKIIGDILNAATPSAGSDSMGSLVVPYCNSSSYGRMYARGPSCQKLSRLGKSAAFRSHAVDIDMENCHPTLLARLLREAYTSDENDVATYISAFPTLCSYVENYREWRTFAQSYYDVSLQDAKKILIRIFYGGRCPRGDVPFLHQLRIEVMKAAKYLAGHRFYAHLGVFYKDRKRPLYGHLAAILSFEEEKSLKWIVAGLKRDPVCLVHDGAVFPCDSMDSLLSIRMDCARVGRELGVGISVKQWETLAHVEDESGLYSHVQDLLIKNKARTGADLSVLPGSHMCLYNAVNFLGTPALYSVEVGGGPFSVKRYNERVRMSVRDAAGRHYLGLRQATSVGELDLSKSPNFVCYVQPKCAFAAVGHFFAARFNLSADEVEILDDAQVTEVKVNISTFDTIMRKYVTYIYQAQGDFPDMEPDEWSYFANGGCTQGPIMATKRVDCADCGSALGRLRSKAALVYGFHAASTVRHGFRKCNNRERNARYWHNYRYIGGNKIYSHEGSRGDVVFVNSNVGFDLEFIHYVQKLHFYGYLSFSALVKSHAAIYNSPATSHFKTLLPSAFFLVHAVREYGAAGIDVGSIVIGEETNTERNAIYSAYILETAFRPRYIQSVTAVVSDGNAKVLTKCGKGVPAPKRAGAPMKRRGGGRMGPKPFWNGWFFYICPKSSMILLAVAMYGPENNAIVLDGLERVTKRYPYANCFIYDRACKILKDVKDRRRRLWKIKTYATDKFHGLGHKASCPVNPYSLPALMRRLRGINTVIAEQTFSWFRGYARSMNELKPERHQFLAHCYAKEHNELMANGDTSHLNPHPHRGNRRSTPYECEDGHRAKRRRKA